MYAKKDYYDIVCGSRYVLGGSKSGGPIIQGLFSIIVNSTLHGFLHLPIHDISNSFKLYNRKILLKHINDVRSCGVESSMELFLRAHFDGATSTEVPTHWIGRSAGKSKFKLSERSFQYLRIYLWAIRTYFKEIFFA